MPDKRCHRGPDPEDERLFAPSAGPNLRAATSDLCWLLNRGYALPSAAELVGNRYALARRQRVAISRCACTEEARQRRQHHQVDPAQLRGQELWLDGYNVLTALEAALAGGVILQGCDGCLRDIAGVHAHYRQVEETLPALRLVGEAAGEWGVCRCHWWLDRPVSNSGRLKNLLLELAARAGWNWEVDLVFSPDAVLAQTEHIIATADSVILNRCARWLNLVRILIGRNMPQVRLIDLAADEEP